MRRLNESFIEIKNPSPRLLVDGPSRGLPVRDLSPLALLALTRQFLATTPPLGRIRDASIPETPGDASALETGERFDELVLAAIVRALQSRDLGRVARIDVPVATAVAILGPKIPVIGGIIDVVGDNVVGGA